MENAQYEDISHEEGLEEEEVQEEAEELTRASIPSVQMCPSQDNAIAKLMMQLAEDTRTNSLLLKELLSKPDSSKRKSQEDLAKIAKVPRSRSPEAGPSSGHITGAVLNDQVAGTSSSHNVPILPPPVEPEISDLDALENMLDKSENEGGTPLEVIGSEASPNFVPPSYILDWFFQVADISLKDNDIAEIDNSFRLSEEHKPHFMPPRFPNAIWESFKRNTSDVFKQKSLFKSQSTLCTAIKPLLATLGNLPPEDSVNRANICKSIQLICSANLEFSRFRRILSSQYLKFQYKKSFLKLPVKHDNLFGEDFEKSSKRVIEEHSSCSRVIAPPRRNNFNFRPQSENRFDNTAHEKFRGRGRSSNRRSRGSFHRSRGKPQGGTSTHARPE